jgi:cysteinyl-tRNA synthetase
LDTAAESSPGLAPEPTSPTGSFEAARGGSPFLGDAHRIESEFASSLAASAADDATAAVLELDQLLLDWSRDTLQSDEMDTARSMLRSMIVRLGEAAESGLADPRGTVGPFVESLLELRAALREEHNFRLADRVRERLTQAGVEVRDSPEGTTWHLT